MDTCKAQIELTHDDGLKNTDPEMNCIELYMDDVPHDSVIQHH
jgi:hypothetical protein